MRLRLLGRHRVERAHVVQAVGELDQDDAHVARHRQQHLAEVLGLRVLARSANSILSSLDTPSTISATGLPNVDLELVLGDAVSSITSCSSAAISACASSCHSRQDARDRERVRDVGLAGLAELAAVRGLGELECALDERDVGRRQVVAEVPGEFGNLGHARLRPVCDAVTASTVGAILVSISMPTLPAAISRSAMTVGLSRSGVDQRRRAGRDLARAVGGGERQLEAVGNAREDVVDGDAGHGDFLTSQG